MTRTLAATSRTRPRYWTGQLLSMKTPLCRRKDYLYRRWPTGSTRELMRGMTDVGGIGSQQSQPLVTMGHGEVQRRRQRQRGAGQQIDPRHRRPKPKPVGHHDDFMAARA